MECGYIIIIIIITMSFILGKYEEMILFNMFWPLLKTIIHIVYFQSPRHPNEIIE